MLLSHRRTISRETYGLQVTNQIFLDHHLRNVHQLMKSTFLQITELTWFFLSVTSDKVEVNHHHIFLRKLNRPVYFFCWHLWKNRGILTSFTYEFFSGHTVGICAFRVLQYYLASNNLSPQRLSVHLEQLHFSVTVSKGFTFPSIMKEEV